MTKRLHEDYFLIRKLNSLFLIILLFCIFFSPILFSKSYNFEKIIKNLKPIKSPVIYRNFDKICQSIEIHNGKPGFDKILNQLEIFLKHPRFKNNPALALGIIYEITESLELVKEKRTASKFQITLSCPDKNIKRILDTQSQDSNEYFEYKNVYWPWVDQNKKITLKIINQLLDEKYLAKKMGNDFELRSNQPLTEFWKEWLKKEKISFKDNTKSCINDLD